MVAHPKIKTLWVSFPLVAFEAAIEEVAAVMMDAMEGMRATAMAIEVALIECH